MTKGVGLDAIELEQRSFHLQTSDCLALRTRSCVYHQNGRRLVQPLSWASVVLDEFDLVALAVVTPVLPSDYTWGSWRP